MELDAELRKWLVDEGDPSVRYRALLDLEDRSSSDADVIAAGTEIGRSGWAAKILSQQLPGGQWESAEPKEFDDLYLPKYISSNWRLLVLSDLGMTREDSRIDRAVSGLLGLWHAESGSVFHPPGAELCITGNTVRMLLRFGYADLPGVAAGLDWLLGTQKSDGGWHCFPSEVGTLDCWEALAAFDALPRDRWTPRIRESVQRGAEFYLSRGLLTESDGSTCAPWRRYHYPHHYYYDVLLGMDLLAALGYARDPRLQERLDELLARRDPQGRWSLDALHPDIEPADEYYPTGPYYPFGLEAVNRPSRWITLLALRTLRRAGRL